MQQKILDLISIYKHYGIDAYIVPSCDEFQSEYPNKKLDRFSWLTSFSCSNGTLIITQLESVLFTDGRYLLQAERELAKTCKVLDMYKSISCDYIAQIIKPGFIMGYDPMLHTINNLDYYQKLATRFNFTMKALDDNLVDILKHSAQYQNAENTYTNQHKIIEKQHITEKLDIKYSGIATKDKLEQVLSALDKDVDCLFVTRLDSICWLLNIRGNAIPYTPFLLAYLLIDTENKKLSIFVEDEASAKIALTDEFIDSIEIFNIQKIKEEFPKLISGKRKIQLDPESTPIWFVQQTNCYIKKEDPIQLPKAIKNHCEIEGFRTAHIHDGVAVTEFLSWLQNTSDIDEITASEKLLEYRSASNLFRYPSFETISAYGPNAAMIHYRPNKKRTTIIKPDNLYLLDSGGQYICGTTDVTRTVCMGTPSKEQILDFTLTLKGHIRLALTKFPENTKGSQLDSLARFDLWRYGKNYQHGTGHGVGHFLSVHEGPQRISHGKGNDVALMHGMILSNEPGFYKPNEYGIRIENLVLVQRSQYKEYLEFETLTLVPIAYNLIDFQMLDKIEIEWLLNYHNKIYDMIYIKLTDRARIYLDSHMNFYHNYSVQ